MVWEDELEAFASGPHSKHGRPNTGLHPTCPPLRFGQAGEAYRCKSTRAERALRLFKESPRLLLSRLVDLRVHHIRGTLATQHLQGILYS